MDGDQPDDSNQGGTLNTEDFIEEIRKQRSIWDLSADEYFSRTEKIKAWEKVGSKSNATFDHLPAVEKDKIVIELQKRWKNLKTCFNREKSKKNNVTSGSAANDRKEYEYYKQLSFLLSVSKTKPSQANATNVKPGPSNTPKKEQSRLSGNTNEASAVEEYENEALTTSANNLKRKRGDENDPDLHFLLSILPHLKKVPDDCKLDLQTDILNTIKRYIPKKNQSQYGDYYSNRSYIQNSENISLSIDVPASPAITNVPQESIYIKEETD